jgi:membrane protease YdiL (CAAX protease family)
MITAKLFDIAKRYWVIAWIGLALLVIQLSLLVKSDLGVYVNALSLASLVALALKQAKYRQLALAAAVLPAATMVTLSLPQSSHFGQAVIFNDALFILAIIYRFGFDYRLPIAVTRLKAINYAIFLPVMLVIGEALGLIGFGLLRHHTGFGSLSLPGAAIALTLFALAEETYFRGLIQQRASLVFNPKLAAALTAILYAVFSASQGGGYLSLLYGLLAGVVLSTTYSKKPNLVLTFTINAASKLLFVGLLASFVIH